MPEHRIAVISDTHNLLRPEVLEHLKECEAILHGGDISSQEILDTLKAYAPVYVVRGNNDKEWAEDIPVTRSLTLDGLRIFMVHKKGDIPKNLTDTDLVIFGHSHRYEASRKDGILFLNPGSCGPRRFGQAITMAYLHIREDGSFYAERIDIPHKGQGKAGSGKTADGAEAAASGESDVKDQYYLSHDPQGLIRKVVSDVDRGRTTAQIADKYRISIELADTISRMYLTHPGVTAEGIMTKMGL